MQEEPIEPEDAEVHLRPILGIAPTTYVPVLYGLLGVIVLFALLVLPGLLNHGSEVTVISSPPGASILIDDVRMTSSPDEIFVDSGTRVITLRLPGFQVWRDTIEFRGRLFGSLLFPVRQYVSVTLEPENLNELARQTVADMARWGFTGEASGQFQFPPMARALGRNLGIAADSEAREMWDSFAESALPAISSEGLLADFTSGALSANSPSIIATPFSIASAVQSIARASADGVGMGVQLAGILTPERRPMVAASEWAEYSRDQLDSLDNSREAQAALAFGGSIPVPELDSEFVEIPRTTTILGGEDRASRGGDIPYSSTTDWFAISTQEVTVALFARFLSESPEWGIENKATLIAEGKVDDDYLSQWPGLPDDTDLPVTGVSWFAAEAFSRWATLQLSDTSYAIRLPTEPEWELVAQIAGPETGVFASADTDAPVPVDRSGVSNRIYGLLGNVWEWTSSWYAPYSRYYPVGLVHSAAHKVVRGGGWATDPRDFAGGDRGSLDPSWCSRYVGFRIVLSEK